MLYQAVTIIIKLLTAAVGIWAAWYWYRSSRVVYPSNLRGVAPIGGMVDVAMNPLLGALQESGRLNKKAAELTAVAVILGAIAALI